jgi:hypothetical protein
MFIDLADELDQRMVEERLDLFLEVLLVDLVDLRSNLERHAGANRDLDRPVRALLRGDPS